MKRRERELRAESVLSKGKRGKTEKQGKALRGERGGKKGKKAIVCLPDDYRLKRRNRLNLLLSK